MHRLALAALLCLPLAADNRQVTRWTSSHTTTTIAVSRQGSRQRMEVDHGGSQEVTLLDQAAHRVYRLDMRDAQYVESNAESADVLTVLAAAIERPGRPRQSGKTVTVSYETKDTGERREAFGQTARHLIVTERRVAEAGACERSRTSVTDGWYLNSPHTPGSPHLEIGLGGRCQDHLVIHGAPPSGIAVEERSEFGTREVLQLSNERLDPALFQVPSGFKKVGALPGERPVTWSDRMEADLDRLHVALLSWVR